MLSAVNVLTKCPKILHITKRDFFQLNFPEWSINMIKLLSFRFQQSFDPFTMVLVVRSSETGRFRYISNHVFRSKKKKKYISYEDHLFFGNVQNWVSISKMKQKIGKIFFCFWDNCIWRYCNTLPLLRREYLSSAVSVLTNSPKLLHITKRDFFQLNSLESDQWLW